MGGIKGHSPREVIGDWLQFLKEEQVLAQVSWGQDSFQVFAVCLTRRGSLHAYNQCLPFIQMLPLPHLAFQ